MTNATPRAHVQQSAPEIPVADLDRNRPQTSDESDCDCDRAIETASRISPRKEQRRQRKLKKVALLPSPPDTDNETVPSSPLPKLDRTPTEDEPALAVSIPSTPASLSAMPPANNASQKAYSLLVCSIGNPGSTYANTFHSAGHFITTHISTVKSYRPFTKGLSGLISRPDNTQYSFGFFQGYRKEEGPPPEDDWTFWQSTSLMNVSGGGVKKAWTEFERQLKNEGLEGRLVVVHDELESALGKVSVRDGAASAKGHNGLKSCQASLRNLKWWRVGVGIGRPESREPAVVSRYVLRKMDGGEQKALEKSATGVVDALRQIAEGKK